MKSDYTERRYKLNRQTSVVIKSKRQNNAEIYTNSITLVHETAGLEPLEMKTREDIEKSIKAIDLDDDQLSLNIGKPEPQDDSDQ